MIALSPQNQAIILSALALLLDFFNGLHGNSNVVATMIASRAMSGRSALLLASVATIAAPFIFGVAVAETIGRGIVDPGIVDARIITAALVGAIAWSLVTWYLGIPSSSSHALLGGLMGSVLVGRGVEYVQSPGLLKTALALLVSPFAGMLAGYVLMRIVLFLCRAASPKVNRFFKRGQLLTALALALSFGANSGQRGMGIIAMSLVSLGLQDVFMVPLWAILACGGAIALGTCIGGSRIIKTVGSKIYRVRTVHGFVSQAAAAGVILGAGVFGGPVSATQVISSTVMGVGSAERLSRVRWGVVGQILLTWLTTIPASAAIAALLCSILQRV